MVVFPFCETIPHCGRVRYLYVKLAEQFLHVRRHPAFERQSVTIYRMDEPEIRGVQGLTAETKRFKQRLLTRPVSTVDRVAEQGVPDRGHVDAHLMRATRF